MADYKNCSIGALNPAIILARLCASDTTFNGMRVMNVTGTTTVEACGDYYSLEELRTAVIGIATDGLPAVRVFQTYAQSGSGLTECSLCAAALTAEEIEKSFYVKTAAGEVALCIWNIT